MVLRKAREVPWQESAKGGQCLKLKSSPAMESLIPEPWPAPSNMVEICLASAAHLG